MRNLYTLLTAIIITTSAFAQAPEMMSYQAVIRDGSNALVASSSVGMQISILQGSSSGTAVYVETQTPTSNANGLVSVEIGGGIVVSGTFASIDWANGPYFIKTETDPTGGTSYTITGTSQLLSVPYALHAKASNKLIYNAVSSNGNPIIMNDDNLNERFSINLNYDNLATQIDFNPLELNSNSNVNLRFFRATNTIGVKRILFQRGNGTTNLDGQIGVDGTNSFFQVYGGNFGIGTSTPSYPLEVAGTLGSTSVLSSGALFIEKNANAQILLRNTINTLNSNLSSINFERGDGSGTDAYISTISDGNNGISKIGLAFTATESVFLNANGNVELTSGDVYLKDIGTGVIIKSPNGNCWRVTVDNTGNFVSTAITCP